MEPQEPPAVSPPADPVEVLEGEHEVILAVVDAIEKEMQRVARGKPMRRGFWLDVAEFLDNFADRCHHAKEEDVLFAMLAATGMPRDRGLLAVLGDEHVEARMLKQRIRMAAEYGRAGELVRAALGYVLLERRHVERERTSLLVETRRRLDAEQTAQLLRGFAAADAAMLGGGLPDRYRALARQLCARAGTGAPPAPEPHAAPS